MCVYEINIAVGALNKKTSRYEDENKYANLEDEMGMNNSEERPS